MGTYHPPRNCRDCGKDLSFPNRVCKPCFKQSWAIGEYSFRVASERDRQIPIRFPLTRWASTKAPRRRPFNPPPRPLICAVRMFCDPDDPRGYVPVLEDGSVAPDSRPPRPFVEVTWWEIDEWLARHSGLIAELPLERFWSPRGVG